VHGQAEEQIGHAQQRVQQEQNEAGDDQPPHGSTLLALELGETLFALYLGRGDRKTDIRQFGISCARPGRYLLKPRRGDCDTDTTEAPTQSSRLAAGQRPIMHQEVMRRACHERQF
jgi:hypothetical protein